MTIAFRYAGWLTTKFLETTRAREEGLDHIFINGLLRAARMLNAAHGPTVIIRVSFEGHGSHHRGAEVFDIACVLAAGPQCRYDKLLFLQSKKITQRYRRPPATSPFTSSLPTNLENIVARTYWHLRPFSGTFRLGERKQIQRIQEFNRSTWPVHYLFYAPGVVGSIRLGTRIGRADDVLALWRSRPRGQHSLAPLDVANFPRIYKWIELVLNCGDGNRLDADISNKPHKPDSLAIAGASGVSSRFFLVAEPAADNPQAIRQQRENK